MTRGDFMLSTAQYETTLLPRQCFWVRCKAGFMCRGGGYRSGRTRISSLDVE